jgi:hypothetical protein
MSASGSKGILSGETRLLAERWAETRKTWRDQKALDFEEAYLADLFGRVSSTIRVIEELEQLLNKVHADCD